MRATRLTLMIIGAAIPSVASCSPVHDQARERTVQPDGKADTGKTDAHQAEKADALSTKPEESIGVATQEPDGTIVLQLRASGGGSVGDGLLRYPPNHPNYAEVKAHVGPIPPGKSVPVKPFD